MTTCASCGQTVPEVKTEPGEHVDYQPPSEPSSQTPVPPGFARLRVDGNTETEIAIPDERWKREGGMDEAAYKALGLEPVEDDDTEADGDGLSLFEGVEPGPDLEAQPLPQVKGFERGTYVTWPGGAGRIDLVVVAGRVPGVDSPLVGTKDLPVLRIATTDRKKVAVTADLVSAAQPPAEVVERKGLDALIDLVESRAIPAGLSAARTEVAYRRGLKGWPGADVTSVSQEDWALGRATALVEAKCGRPIDGFADGDLLA